MSPAASHALRAAAFINGLQAATSAGYRPRYPELAASVLLTFCRCAPTVLQNICRRVALRHRLNCYKERSTF
jgi:hypothetical protein